MSDVEDILGIPTIELLGLWADLVDAEHGKNGFGGDTAELYAYRFGALSPTWYLMRDKPDHEWVVEAELESARRLLAFLKLFAEKRKVRLYVDGRAPGKWLLKERFSHRVHVQVRA